MPLNTNNSAASNPAPALSCTICLNDFKVNENVLQAHPTKASTQSKTAQNTNQADPHLFHIECLAPEMGVTNRLGTSPDTWKMPCPTCRTPTNLTTIEAFKVGETGLEEIQDSQLTEALIQGAIAKQKFDATNPEMSERLTPSETTPDTPPESYHQRGRHPTLLWSDGQSGNHATPVHTALFALGTVALLSHAPIAILVFGVAAGGTAIANANPFQHCQNPQGDND